MKKFLNAALLTSFILTCPVSLTGIHIHKLASTMFLLLCLAHTVVYRKKLGIKRYGLLALVMVSFLSGLFGMIFDQWPLVLAVHKTLSIVLVFFLAIHIFIFQKKLR